MEVHEDSSGPEAPRVVTGASPTIRAAKQPAGTT
jgi:hypothetical protein